MYFIVMFLLVMVVNQIDAFAFFSQRCIRTTLLTCSAKDVLAKEPIEINARLQLMLGGDSVSTALFRSDLNKEAVFRRGCAVRFTEKSNKSVEVIMEGKTKQIVRFIPWLRVLASELNSTLRKPNFQGPSIKISIDDAKWLTYTGEIKGFVSTGPPPVLGDTPSAGTMEAKSMTGTDESV